MILTFMNHSFPSPFPLGSKTFFFLLLALAFRGELPLFSLNDGKTRCSREKCQFNFQRRRGNCSPLMSLALSLALPRVPHWILFFPPFWGWRWVEVSEWSSAKEGLRNAQVWLPSTSLFRNQSRSSAPRASSLKPSARRILGRKSRAREGEIN